MSNIDLVCFLAWAANKHGVGEHSYVVGGAVRNHVAGWPVKDFDIALDSVSLGRPGVDSAWFAERLAEEIPARVNLTTNQYGVAILTVGSSWDLGGRDMRGEVIEVANARKESYGGEAGKGYKPHLVAPATIHEDLARREFTFNTLMWRLGELEDGPEGAEVLDYLGCGMRDLEDRIIRTPRDPDVTFSDDPTRMLRAVKFMARYGFGLSVEARESIVRNGPKLKAMPWDAVRKLLVEDVLGAPSPRSTLRVLEGLGLAGVLREMMSEEPGFAAAVGRSMADVPPNLALDMHDLGWPIRTSVSYLEPPGRARLREIVGGMDDAEAAAFNSLLRKPRVDQERLFRRFGIPPKERGSVVSQARAAILGKPGLAADPAELEKVVEASLSPLYPGPEESP